MGTFRSFLFSYPELLLAALCFFSFAALCLARRRRGHALVSMPPFVFSNPGRPVDAATAALRESGCTFMFRGLWVVGADFLVSCDPAAVHHCLAANYGNYDKGRDFAEMFGFGTRLEKVPGCNTI